MKEKSRFASFLFHLGLTSLFGVAIHGDCPDFRGEAAKMGLSPSDRKGTGTFFGPKRAEK